MKIADLFALFRVETDGRSFMRAISSVRQLRNGLLAVGASVAAGGLIKEMIGFNSRVEDAKNNIAAMLALAKGQGTTMASQLGVASQLYDDIRKKASELPGTTEDYVQAMAKLTLPIVTAGGSLEELKDLTVATIVAAKGGVGGATVKTAITDVLQGIEGRFSTTDFFLKAILEPLGFVGKEGRERFKALSKVERFQTLTKGLKNPVFEDLGKAQAKSWTGQVDKAKENFAQFLGKVGKPLFEGLKTQLAAVNAWLEKNKESVDAFATAVSEHLLAAFEFIGEALEYLWENSEEVKDVLTAIGILIGGMLLRHTLLWIKAWAPMFLLVYGLIKLFKFLEDKIGTTGAAIATAMAALTGGLILTKFGAITGAITSMARAMWGYVFATRAAGLAGGSAAGAAIMGGALANGLGPAGKVAPNAATVGAGAAAKGAARTGIGRVASRVLPFVAMQEFFGAMAPKNFDKEELPDSGDFSSTAIGQRDRVLGEWNLQRAYQDVVAVASGRVLGESFGRGLTREGIRSRFPNMSDADINAELQKEEGKGLRGQGVTIHRTMNFPAVSVDMTEAEFREMLAKAETEMNRHDINALGGGTE